MLSWAQHDLSRTPALRELWRGGERFFSSLSGWMQPSAPPDSDAEHQPPRTPQQRVPPQQRPAPPLKKASRQNDASDSASDKPDDRDTPWNL
jgi:hypothetical protein